LVRIGLISDTHGYIDDRILDFFRKCEEIWHAGDIGTTEVADKLSELCRFRAVHGNIDDAALRSKYPENQIFKVEQMKIWITHIGGLPPKYNRKIINGIQEIDPDLFICGHSHIARIIPDRIRNLIYLNPGAAGHQGFHRTRTIMRFSVDQDQVRDLQVIELGNRGLQPK
jgi:putative phosphoesterase